MIQLVFDAADAADALDERPVEVGYSSHEGAEKAAWDDDKLEIVGGTHPVVYPAAGSHANKFTDALYLGSSAEAGVGCDDTRGPHRALTPDVLTIPSDAAAAAEAFPWITFEGRWGELQKAFFNGPTGPNMKTQWLTPIEWSEDWRDRSYAVPTGGVLGTSATDFFCSAVERGSAALASLLRNPPAAFIVLASLLGLLAFVVIKATWTPVAALSGRASPRVGPDPLRVRLDVREAAAALPRSRAPPDPDRPDHHRPPVAPAIGNRPPRQRHGRSGGPVRLRGDRGGSDVDAARPRARHGGDLLRARRARRGSSGRPDHGVPAGAPADSAAAPCGGDLRGDVGCAHLDGVLIPVALWFAVRWALLAPVAELEDRGGRDALRRSAELVRGRWLRVGSLVVLGGLLALVSGPLVGALLIFASNSSLALLNLVAGIVYAVALPFVALVTSYVYFDARTRHELEPREAVDELPAEIALDPS